VTQRKNCKKKNDEHSTYLSSVDNLNSIEYSVNDNFKLIKSKISHKQVDTKHFNSSLKLLVLLLGIWSEARLNKLVNEYDIRTSNNLFTDLEKKLIKLNKQKIEEWKTIIELAFRKHYNLYIGNKLDENNLGSINFQRYVAILDIVENYLQSIIENRNKLAHGQWVCQLNSKGNLLDTENTKELMNENIITLEKKYQILKLVTQIIHDLMISKRTFERDFSKNYNGIIERKKFIDKHASSSYQKLINKLQKNNI